MIEKLPDISKHIFAKEMLQLKLNEVIDAVNDLIKAHPKDHKHNPFPSPYDLSQRNSLDLPHKMDPHKK